MRYIQFTICRSLTADSINHVQNISDGSIVANFVEIWKANLLSNIASVNISSVELVFFCFLFYSVERPFQEYFTHIETSHSVGGAKREYPGKTT